ncbi:protein kinase domain-containing protein [Streptomyces sp. NRRL B-1347]|uniref:serine/threonine-protein kinase n=1 Tax=Streptomyces sp. NRRL B-1347 TaxID=1476877 RepID=UPI00131E0550|nr:serine/threonine-protein kinase [Streptomyces sp. NRRL B-1347]
MRDSSPRRTGPYETVARLGAGGMGEVFLAVPHAASAAPEGPRAPYDPDGLVAVKAIRRDVVGEPAFRARFRREIAVARSVASPYVARLVDGDADAEQPWLATEYVAGLTLAEAVRRHGPLPVPAVAALGTAMAGALAAVHAAGALHRDLKPANVLIGPEGPKLIDFGVARIPGATTMTSTGLLVGTPGFMSPEHVAGGRHVVAASDVFCLASVLVYAAVGRDPFGDGPVAAVLYRVSRAEAELDDVPAELREVLADCLVVDAAARPGPEALAERLAGLAGAGLAGADGAGADGACADGVDFAWPAPVQEAIDEVRRDVAQLCAAGRPLLPLPAPPAAPPGQEPTPTWSPTALNAPAAPGSPAAHELPTMGAAAPAAATVPGAPRRRGRRAAFAVVAAVAVAGGAAGALLALFGPDSGSGSGDDGAQGGPAGPGASASSGLPPARLIAAAGVDKEGTDDRSGSVPQYPEQRPKGWKPWRGSFSHAPLHCAADTRAVVCLLTNGTYEAIGASDGKRRWTSDGRTGDDGDTGGEAYVSPTGKLFMPGDSLAPVVRGGTSVIAHKGLLQVRDSASGDVRLSARPPEGRYFSRALLGDGLILVTAEAKPYADGGPQGAMLLAYPLRGGAPRWTAPLSTQELSGAELNGLYGAEVVRNGRVYAWAAQGLIALDVKTGARGGKAYDGEQCLSVMAVGRQILCSAVVTGSSDFEDAEEAGTRVTRLNAGTLAAEGAFAFKAPPVGKGGMVPPDLVVTAVGPGSALAYDAEGAKLLVAESKKGRIIRKEPLPAAGDGSKRVLSSRPLLIGDRALFADHTSLRTVPLTASGGSRTLRVPGAPGTREPKQAGDVGVIADQLRPPTVLPLGGVATIVYDQGTVVSVRIPS